MKMLARAAIALSALFAGPALAATVSLPNCLNSPSIYTPCQGMVAVDPTTGNPVPWSSIGGGTASGASTVGLTAPTSGLQVTGKDGSGNAQPLATTSAGALVPPVAGATQITQTSVAVPANASTQIIAANATRIGLEIQCDGTAIIGLDRKGGTLTSAASAPLILPTGSYPLYTAPITPTTAITAYTGTAQTCRVTEYARQ